MMVKITKYILLALCFLFIFGLFSVEIKDPDFWWHLKTGEYIVQTGSVPETDPFAYTSTPKDPLSPESVRIKFILAQYWLAQVLFYWVFHTFDFQGIIFLRAFILTALMFLLYRAIRREGFGIYTSAIAVIPAVLIFKTFTGERPQLFSFLFSFLIVFLIEGFRRRTYSKYCQDISVVIARNPEHFRDDEAISSSLQNTTPRSPRPDCFAPRDDKIKPVFYLIPIPIIMLLWSNVHGGFIVGIALLLCYLVAEWVKYFLKKFSSPLSIGQLKLLSGFIIVSILVTLINPNTYKIIPFLFELESGAYKGMIVEAMSPVVLFRSGFYEIQFFIFFALLLVSLLLLLVNMKNLDLTDIIIFAMLAVTSLSMARFIPFLAPFAILIIARHSKEFMQRIPKVFETIRKNIEIPLNSFFIIVIILMLINGNLFKEGIRGNKYPEGAARFLRENHIAGNMFNPYVWGGYLMWALYPEYKVFIDGRGLIPEVFFQEVRILEASQKPVERLPEWKAFLNAYKVNFITTFSVGNFSGRLVPLIAALMNDPDWHLVYMDNISLIFVRDSEENRGIIRQFSFPKEWLWNEVAVEAALKAQDAPNRGNYYETMGDAFFAKRNYQDAQESYSKALALKPGNTRLQNQIELLESIIRSQGR
jgi:hypothetical protein